MHSQPLTRPLLEQAFASVRTRTRWPATLDACLQHNVYGPCLLGIARNLALKRKARPMSPTQCAELAHRLADAAVLCDIETEGVHITDLDGTRWIDVRPMLDPREHAPEVIDMATQALAYAAARGLVRPHPEHEHYVQVLRAPRGVPA